MTYVSDRSLTKAELNGYTDGRPVPEYRMIAGERKAKNPNGWLMPVFGPASQETIRAPVRDSMASIEELTSEDEGSAMMPLPAIKDDGMMFEQFFVLNPTGLRAIKDRVRSTVLEWALALEKKGISGEGLSFNPREKEAAKTVQNITNFTGSILGGAIVQNVDTGTANAQIGSRLDEVAALVRTVRDRLPSLGLQAEEA